MTTWKTLERCTLLDQGRFLRVECHKVQLPDGRVIPDWPWVITPDYANVVAVNAAGRFLCFRQTKYAVEGQTLSLVGGYLEPGEDPRAGARRELLEETGCRAPDWSFLGRFRVDSNRGAGWAHLFLARGVRPVAAIASDDLEAQQRLWLTRAELERALDRGAFQVLAWTTALALALRRLDRPSRKPAGRSRGRRNPDRRTP